MSALDPYGVHVASSGVAYADGAEAEVLSDLLGMADRSDGSDELAAKIRDWPTRYHYSPLRTNLLRPLGVRPGMRVLDVGCGTGAVTRWLAEQGAQVVGLEGSLPRAQAAAVRCAGLPNVAIIAGTMDDIPAEPEFDLIVVVGVLEYSPMYSDPVEGPKKLLDDVRRRLAPDGVLALAIENQLGLKYLLGYAEDHHSLAWVGVEGYARGGGPRTWTKATLTAMLERSGFSSQRWLFPFPDYKLPSVILDERLYRHPAAHKIVNDLLRAPVTADASAPSLVCDTRLAHRQMLEAGIGPDVANSFFVLAAPDSNALAKLAGDELAWIFGSDRRRQWRRERVVVEDEGALRITERDDPSRLRVLAWLNQAVEPAEGRPFVAGEPLDVLLTDAIRRRDMDVVIKLLRGWREHLENNNVPRLEESPGFPFDPLDSTDLALPGDFLDVGPANFIVEGGELVFIDREWEAAAPVSAKLVETRALWWFAQELVESGEPHPWAPLASVDQVAQSLCALAAIACPDAVLEHWRRSEIQLQQLVHRGDPSDAEHALKTIGSRRTIDVSPRVLPFTSLRAAVDEGRRVAEGLQSRLDELEPQLEAVRSRAADLEREMATQQAALAQLESSAEALDQATTECQRLDEQRRQAEASLASVKSELSRLEDEHQRWLARFAALERRTPVRVFRRLQRIVRRHG